MAQLGGVPSKAALYSFHWRPQLQLHPAPALSSHRLGHLLTAASKASMSCPISALQEKFQSLVHKIWCIHCLCRRLRPTVMARDCSTGLYQGWADTNAAFIYISFWEAPQIKNKWHATVPKDAELLQPPNECML